MVKIRMARHGTKKKPFYRIVIADSESPRNGAFVEIVGTFDPKSKAKNVVLENERIEYWLKCGAQPSEAVKHILKRAKKAAA